MLDERFLSENNLTGFSAKKKASSVLIPVLFFILFDCLALSINYLISFQLSANAVAINLAGRQRMLSQRMAKAILISQSINAPSQHAALSELRDAVTLFDQTLAAFWVGGKVLDTAGNEIWLPPTTAPNTRLYLASAVELWAAVKQTLAPISHHSNRHPASSAQTEAATEILIRENLKLLNLMNALTLSLEQSATRNAGYLRLIQSLFLVFAFVNFFIIYNRLKENIRQTRKNSEALLRVFNSIDTCIILYDNRGRVFSTNKAAEQLFGYSNENFKKKHINSLITKNNFETIGLRNHNQIFKARANYQQIFQGWSEINVCTVHDISQQQEKEEHLTQLAFHDCLTELPNRLLFYERLQHDLLHAKRNSTLLAVLFLDLDGFKEVNDSLGHEAGDQLLKMVAKRLIKCCREDDTVARMGGDEFTIILSSINSEANLQQISGNILSAISMDFPIKERQINLSISIGISVYPNDSQEVDALLKLADHAMFEAKKSGKNNYFFAANL